MKNPRFRGEKRGLSSVVGRGVDTSFDSAMCASWGAREHIVGGEFKAAEGLEKEVVFCCQVTV